MSERPRRLTDNEQEDHFCERQICLFHGRQEEDIKSVIANQGPSWKYYTFLVLLVLGCYSYTFYSTSQISSKQIEMLTLMTRNTEKINNLESSRDELMRNIITEIRDIKRQR